MADIDLTSDLDRFVRSQVQAGRFPTPSDVIAVGLRRLEEHIAMEAEHRDELLAAIVAAFDDSRPGIPVASAFAWLEERHARRVDGNGGL
ncbi:type II toxin-antitoxin system ParD family antitoxin [Methylobacterium sp. J-026]|uniref:type II toxin-antitoxin system ParD family antitoxin n=1 Tax=Methylobacterium sp. J-026 TaxID=2836624 RepID=UPI001FB92CCF|nr:type II toxin-antitoxin system ParD family antitoxin [Methylobacterium sp. J-026]MCJ2135834.1 type II toxin-antitoxin system ParD family antitoxin [Methylobacterium sp. J-026]